MVKCSRPKYEVQEADPLAKNKMKSVSKDTGKLLNTKAKELTKGRLSSMLQDFCSDDEKVANASFVPSGENQTASLVPQILSACRKGCINHCKL